MSIFDLSGRVAVITGGNGGIGLGIAQALALSGCNVSIWGRNAEKNKAAAATMAKGPGKVDTRICEPSDFGGIAVYLMSKASSYHTADCFVIDGGYTAF
jgi:NAD(P)-dependent dehydrogenase (short-subunit alcohol dehydrogenase family)